MAMLSDFQIRTALRAKIKAGDISAFRIARGCEIHVRDHVINGTVRQGWTLYAYTSAPELGLMLGLEAV